MAQSAKFLHKHKKLSLRPGKSQEQEIPALEERGWRQADGGAH